MTMTITVNSTLNRIDVDFHDDGDGGDDGGGMEEHGTMR
jgi:hypothetical protein